MIRAERMIATLREADNSLAQARASVAEMIQILNEGPIEPTLAMKVTVIEGQRIPTLEIGGELWTRLGDPKKDRG